MYIVKLGSLPPLQYGTVEEAWESPYLKARRGCICIGGCRCGAFDRFKGELETVGRVKLHAAVVYAEGVAR